MINFLNEPENKLSTEFEKRGYIVKNINDLNIFNFEKAIKEIERVGKKKYIMLESYRNNKELFNL
jgi:hypothetical protein|tara:strand:+ start:2650 stop:2844 length:195 start_codon:yes stop_codon:yes gene_type:complete